MLPIRAVEQLAVVEVAFALDGDADGGEGFLW